uniref:RAB3GAP2_N domain-containing protein n=1 Tax=Caenorhabditis tropicalis TaxID=1561998 RepID=A0A1I7V513_9PELO
MSVTPVNLEAYCAVSDEVAKQVKKYLLGDFAEESRFQRKNSSESSDGSETQFCKTTEKKENVEEWDDWGDKEEEKDDTLESDESIRNWLFRCDLKTYSDAEYLMVTWESRFVVLRKPPDETFYKIVCKQYIDGDPMSNEITASCLFGLSNVRHIDLLDSIIIALGTLDGHVYFYTEQGTMLYYDRFSIFEPVNSLQFDVVKTGQTFIVVFTKGFFMINPISLKSVLYQAKVLIAKGEKTVQQISESIELQSELLAPNIKGNIIHVVFTGLQKPSTFDQYVSASYDSFYAAVQKPSLPLYSTFMVTTEKEFAVFVWHDREEQEKLIDDVIKYGKSLLPSFGIRKFLGISTEPTRIPSHMRSAVHAPTRSLILEERIAQSVSRSPDSSYVAVTDRMARVIVIDVINRQVVLIFKGYRDATVSWVSATEEERVAQFLTIFAPRRSLLEVWTVLGNIRVCAQHVPSSECNVVSGGETKMLCGRCHIHSDTNSFFIDDKGGFHRIALPFHLALTSRARQDQHDHLRLKELEQKVVGSDEWFETFSDLRMATSRKTQFQNALHGLKTAEEAHNFIARIRSLSTSGSLGEFPIIAEKSVAFYARIISESKNSIGEYEKRSKYDLDSIVERILECHMNRFSERNDMIDDVLRVGEWLKYVDLSQEDIDIFSEHWPENRRILLANLLFSPLFGSFEIDEYYDTVLEKLPVSRQNIVKLFHLKLEKTTNRLDWRTFDRTVELFVNLEKSETGILEQIDRIAMDTKNVTLGMILLTACWCARNVMRKLKENEKKDEEEVEDEEEKEKDEKNETLEEWDAVAPEVEHLDSIMMCLHCVSLAQTLIENNSDDARIADVAQRIDSYIRENVAKWIVNDSIDTEIIEKLFPRDPTENLAEEGNEEDRRNQMIIDFPDDKEDVIRRMYVDYVK